MKEFEPGPGSHISQACEKLVNRAPAFMVFNDVRVEAAMGDTAGDVHARWSAEMDRKRAEYEASDLYKQRQAEAEARAVVERARQADAVARIAASGVREKFPWTPSMGEISGFGGGYEEACRNMVYAGLAWLQAKPNADLSAGTTADAKALEDVLCEAEPGCSGAMHGATMNAVAFIHRNGWDEYVFRMMARSSELPSDERSK